MEKIGIVVTVRVKSRRIPDKALQEIKGRKTIEILLDNIANEYYPIVVAIPSNKDDDVLEDVAFNRGVEVYRGEDDSPLHRLAAVADKYGFEHVVRITADDILIDKQILFEQIKYHTHGGHDYTYVRRCLQGSGAEVIRASVLEQVADELQGRSIEFVSYYIKNRFKTFEYYPPFPFQYTYRCVMDYPEDLMLLRVIFACLPWPFSSLDVIHFLRQHKYFLNINHLPEATIYTCNYNTGKYIKECMDSVINQTFDDFEYVVLDDGSTDDSMNVITEFHSSLSYDKQQKIKVLRNDENIGLPASSNRVLVGARGRFVVRVDSDDTISPGYLSKVIEEAKLTGADGIITGYNITDETLKVKEKVLENKWHPGGALLSTWVCNELKFKDGLEYLEGEEFFKRFRENYKVKFIKESLWNYRQRPGQKTQDENHPHNRDVK